MEKIYYLKMWGEQVSEDIIIKFWEELRDEIGNDYPQVKSFVRPLIQAWVVPSDFYIKAIEGLLSSGHLNDTSKIEYGTTIKHENASACVFFLNDDRTWLIIKRKNWGFSLEHDLKHELSHIYESTLLLKWCALKKINLTEKAPRLGEIDQDLFY